jgi:hypothetical protein
MMDRGQLRRLLPQDKNDIEAARRLAGLGLPEVEPVLPDMLRWLGVYRAPVGDVFCEFFGRQDTPGNAAIPEISRALLRSGDDALIHRIVIDVLPQWRREAVECVAPALSTLVTQTNLCGTDLRCILLLHQHGLTDVKWLRDWLFLKQDRLEKLLGFSREIEKLLG